jgi:hypothetical protein
LEAVQKYCLLLSFFSLVCLLSQSIIKRWMMPRHILVLLITHFEPYCCTHLGLVMDTKMWLQGPGRLAPLKCVWAPPNTSWTGKWAVRKKERSKQYFCTTSNKDPLLI